MKRIGLFLLALCLCAAPRAHAQDDIDLSHAVLTPASVASWPATAQISRVEVRPDGLHIEFSKRTGADRWPDVTPPGWDGPIQFTVWLGAQVNGRWHLAASMNVWYGEGEGSGGGVYAGPVTDPSQYPKNLYYLDDALKGHTPEVGESLALFVTAGAQRGLNAFAVAERSDVVLFTMPGPNGAAFNYGAAAPPPVVTPPPAPQPAVVVAPPVDLSGVLAKLDALSAQLDAVKADIEAHDDANKAAILDRFEQIRRDLQNTGASLLTRIFTLGLVR
jgi:hypothetical protein